MMTNTAQFALRRSISIIIKSLKSIIQMLVFALFQTMYQRLSLLCSPDAPGLSSSRSLLFQLKLESSQ